MTKIKPGKTVQTRTLNTAEAAAVSGGMMMLDPIDACGVSAWAIGGPVGYLVYQGGLGVGEAINGALGRKGRRGGD